MQVTGAYTIAILSILMICILSAQASASDPGAYITGYVVDEDGAPVPFANVSLWQDGHPWEQTKFLYSNGSSQLSRMAGNNEWDSLIEGGYAFGYVFPGNYTVIAEKGGYIGKTNVTVPDNTTSEFVVNPTPIPVKITLNKYYLPTLTQEQRAYTGAIAGNIWSDHGERITYATVTLWKDGKKIDRLDNPQGPSSRPYSGTNVDYLFDHLAPGSYNITVESDIGLFINGTIAVNVNSRPMQADIVVTRLKAPPPGYSSTETSISPTIGEFSTSTASTPESKPSPALAWWAIPLVISIMAYVICRRRDYP